MFSPQPAVLIWFNYRNIVPLFTYSYLHFLSAVDDSTKSPPVTGTSSVVLRCVALKRPQYSL